MGGEKKVKLTSKCEIRLLEQKYKKFAHNTYKAEPLSDLTTVIFDIKLENDKKILQKMKREC